jgi:hypothetical protein
MSATDSPSIAVRGSYKLSFPKPSLGIRLSDEDQNAPKILSVNSDAGATPQGSLKMPLKGHTLVAVNEIDIMSGGDPYHATIDLIQGSKRPVVVEFCPPPVYSLEFTETHLGISLEVRDPSQAYPSVIRNGSSLSPHLPVAGDIVVKVNNIELDPSLNASTYDQAIRIIKASPRPLTVVFAKPIVNASVPTAVASEPVFLTPTGEKYEVVFSDDKLGFGIDASHDPQELPTVSNTSETLILPNNGDWIETVAGIKLLGEPDTYERAVQLIKTSRRPLTIGFITGAIAAAVVAADALEAAAADAAAAAIAAEEEETSEVASSSSIAQADYLMASQGAEYEVVFSGDRLGISIDGGATPDDFPVVTSIDEGRELPVVGHLIVSVNGVELAGALDTYDRAVQLIQEGGRPVTIGFKSAGNGTVFL